MDLFLPPIDAVFVEGAKYSTLFIGAVEERADVPAPVQATPRKLDCVTVACHNSPHIGWMKHRGNEPVENELGLN